MILSNTTWGKAVLAAAVSLTMTTAPAAAETPQTDFEFDQRVRDALLRNPDIILEVFALLEAKEEAAKAVKDQELIANVAVELFEGLDPAKPILVEFQDYNCGYCRRAHPVVASLKETMPDLQLLTLETRQLVFDDLGVVLEVDAVAGRLRHLGAGAPVANAGQQRHLGHDGLGEGEDLSVDLLQDDLNKIDKKLKED